MTSAHPLTAQAHRAVILMAEDDADHVFLMREAFAEAKLRIDLHHVESGDQCLAFLRRQPPYENAPRPDLLLLDLHMPRVDGYEVMQQIAADPALRMLTVIVLTTSASPADVDRMYALGCKSYLTKPVDFEAFAAAIKQLTDYWFDLVILPGGSARNAEAARPA
jgi:two-component system, chemotaxis family, response regulator Rcp1